MVRPNFKFFNEALLNKTMLFLLDRKFVSTSQNEEFVSIMAFIISIMAFISKKNIINTEEYYFT